MKNNYKHVSEELDYLVKNILGAKYLINPFFRISKITTEQTKIYQAIVTNRSFLYHIFYSISFFIINLFKMLFYFLMSFITLYQYYFILRSREKSDFIFLSHAIGANIIKLNTDQYFGLMPQFLATQKHKVAIFYTNHNKFGYLRNYLRLRKKNLGIEVYLSPKFMLPHESIGFLFKVTTYALNCLRIAIGSIKQDPNQSKMLINAAPYFLSRGTYNNYLLKNRCLSIEKRAKVKFLILTLEGHSYEQYVFDGLRESKSECQSVFYQHSPIVPGHLGLINFLQGLDLRVQIMVTGSIYKKYIASFSNLPSITIVGSQKTPKDTFNLSLKNRDTLLFAPEGTKEATLEFIDLIYKIIDVSLPSKIVLRLHPNLPNSLKIQYHLRKLKNYENFYISHSDLNSDLEASAFVFFRSSAVAVEALLSGAQLVFYSKSNEPEINPLSLLPNLSLEATNAIEIINLLKNENKVINTQARSEVFNQFFTDLNYSSLLKLE
jgi:hypothetical protein